MPEPGSEFPRAAQGAIQPDVLYPSLVSVHNTAAYTDQVYAPTVFGFTTTEAAQTFLADAQAEVRRLAEHHDLSVTLVDLRNAESLNGLLMDLARAALSDPRLYGEPEDLLTLDEARRALQQHAVSPDGPAFQFTGRLAVLDAAFSLDSQGNLTDAQEDIFGVSAPCPEPTPRSSVRGPEGHSSGAGIQVMTG